MTKINDYVTDKRFDPECGSDVLTTEELQVCTFVCLAYCESIALPICRQLDLRSLSCLYYMQNKLKLGVKTKAYVLLLMNLGRIKTTKYKTQIVYKIVS